jgi:DNA damage-inducible protein 1
MILAQAQPEIAAAAENNPQRFAELLRQQRQRQQETELARQREIELLNSDPFNLEAQQRIEEAIREQAVQENMQHAMEYAPESFGRVTML